MSVAFTNPMATTTAVGAGAIEWGRPPAAIAVAVAVTGPAGAAEHPRYPAARVAAWATAVAGGTAVAEDTATSLCPSMAKTCRRAQMSGGHPLKGKQDEEVSGRQGPLPEPLPGTPCLRRAAL